MAVFRVDPAHSHKQFKQVRVVSAYGISVGTTHFEWKMVSDVPKTCAIVHW